MPYSIIFRRIALATLAVLIVAGFGLVFADKATAQHYNQTHSSR